MIFFSRNYEHSRFIAMVSYKAHRPSKLNLDAISHNDICIFSGCNKTASFNYERTPKLGPIYCATHKLYRMNNIRKICCAEIGCHIKPNFNYNNKNAKYCQKHKKENMVNVNSPICNELYCNKEPSFNYRYLKKAVFCRTHTLSGMVNVKCNRIYKMESMAVEALLKMKT